MLENARVTAFTVFELLRENQQGVGKITLHLPTQIRVKEVEHFQRENFGKSEISGKLPLSSSKEHQIIMIIFHFFLVAALFQRINFFKSFAICKSNFPPKNEVIAKV